MINQVDEVAYSPHAADINAVFSQFESAESGLPESSIPVLKEKYGENKLPLTAMRSAWLRFISQFHNVFIYILLFSALISLALQHYVDSAVIFAVVFVNALVGFIQEGKAENALLAIMSMTKTNCMVVRDGTLKSIDSTDLVPGDVVMLQAGDRVPADVRIFFNKDLRCDESALTGEAQPVGKHIQTLPEQTSLAERKNMAYMGTMVTYGLAKGVVVSTGLKTQIGEISDLVGRVEILQTPLQQQLARFARQLTVGIIFISVFTMLLGIYLHNYLVSDMFQAAIGIAVSSIPEGLPAIVTIALAIGVQRMASRNALIRRLPAVEVLGSVDVICSDKTGTLTANAMTARAVFTPVGQYKISGEGYLPQGKIEPAQSENPININNDDSFADACTVSMLCNDANLTHENGNWLLHGDPTEGALLVMALKHGLTVQQTNHDWPRLDILPFESEKRYMATLHHNNDGDIKLMVKGAPDRLLNYATHQLTNNVLTEIDKTQWQQAADDFAKRGMRVMALATKQYQQKPQTLSHSEIENGLTMMALVGISDPPRPEAIESVKVCHGAGIRVKMITGDNPVTAAAIGQELGMNAARVMTGQEIDLLTPDELSKEVERVDIFARTSPANKLQLVTALQQNQHVVAMTGDGVNDAPALKRASIGVAMGQKGTDAAKEAADFVLTDDNFSTIEKAILEGRTVYDNIVKSIVFILPTNLAEALVIFLAIMFGRLMPITPAQILWVNMITAVTLALALAFERSEKGIMNKPPRPFGQGLFSFELLGRMILVGGMGAFIVFSLFNYYRTNGASIEFARTIAVNALVVIEIFYLFNCRFLNRASFNRDFMRGSGPVFTACAVVILLQLVFSYLPISQRIFELESIGLHDWWIIILCSVPVMLVVEVEKWFHRMRKK